MGFLDMSDAFVAKVPARLEATAISIMLIQSVPGNFFKFVQYLKKI
jgi:hypothetical protein